jgi:hypothetical protein
MWRRIDMPYLACDDVVGEAIYQHEPTLETIYLVTGEYVIWRLKPYTDRVFLKPGTIRRIIGRDLTINDKPVEI